MRLVKSISSIIIIALAMFALLLLCGVIASAQPAPPKDLLIVTNYVVVTAENNNGISDPSNELALTNGLNGVKFAWNPSLGATGYSLRCGTNSGQYRKVIPVGTNLTAYAIPPTTNYVTIGGIIQTSADMKTWSDGWRLPAVILTNPVGSLNYRAKLAISVTNT